MLREVSIGVSQLLQNDGLQKHTCINTHNIHTHMRGHTRGGRSYMVIDLEDVYDLLGSIVNRGVMPIQSEWCPLRFLSQVDFKSSFQKTKNSRIIFVIFDTITLYPLWLERPARHHQLLKSNLRSGWCWARDRRVYTALAHYNQSHTILLSLWMQWPIRGIQMSQMSSGRALADWIPWQIISSETTKCRSEYNVRYPFPTKQLQQL